MPHCAYVPSRWCLTAEPIAGNYLEVANIDTNSTPGTGYTANAFTDGITIGGTLLPLNQFHFHSPSEHAVNGQHYPLEMHMVHKLFTASATNNTVVAANTANAHLSQAAVIGIMFQYSTTDGPFLAKLINTLTAITPNVITQANSTNTTTDTDATATFDLMNDIFAATNGTTKYYTYAGSLTTPGCTEGITWYNLANPLTASPAQILNFTYLLSLEQGLFNGTRKGVSRGGDNRLVQPLNGRAVNASWVLPAGSAVTITSSITLTGLTSAGFSSTLRTAFTNTVATAVGVPASAVVITGVADVAATGRRHMLVAAGIAVTYSVTVPTAAAAASVRTVMASAAAGGASSPLAAALVTATGASGAVVSAANPPVVSSAPARAAAIMMSVAAAAVALAF